MERRLAVEGSESSRRLIERPRLTQLLTDSATRITLLVAPAGYGKTTLARQWLGDVRHHVWYPATAASSDVAALALGLADAAAKVVSGAGHELRAQLKASVNPATESESLAKELAADLARWPTNVWLVVDDYHLLADSEAAERFIEAFVADTRMPLLFASRTRPSWVTAKRLLYGEVTEIGRTALAMTHSEAAETLAKSHDEMPGLVSLAEGWPAVIGLAALLPSRLPPSGTDLPETLHEYFAEELYHGLSDELRWNVFQLSLGSAIDDSVTHALFGKRGSVVLEQAYRSGFLTKETGYELHPLLRQFLRTKSSDFGHAEIRRTAEAVGNAYVDESHWDEAAALAEEFSLGDLGLRVLTEALDSVLSGGRLTTLKRWVETARRFAPTASIVRLARIEIDFRIGDWVGAGVEAAQLADAIPADDPLASRIYLRAGQVADLDDRLDEALQFFTESKNVARTPRDLRRALWSRFVTLTDLERHAESADALRELNELSPLGVDDLLRASQGQLHFAIRWGGVSQALERLPQALELVESSTDPIVRTGFLQTYGTGLGQAARYHDADRVAKRQIQEAQRFKLEWVLPHALEMQALARIGLRNFDGALKTLAQARRLATKQGNTHTQVNAIALTARVHLCRGAPERAIEVLEARAARFTSRGMEGDYLATQAFALACCGRPDEARSLIEESERITSHVEARVLRDFAKAIGTYFESEEHMIDSSLLSQVFAASRITGHLDGFVLAYRAFPPILQALSEAAGENTRLFLDLVEQLDPRLMESLGLKRPVGKRRSSEVLTERELEVLELVRQGLSNRDIARTLWIAESTAKAHVHHILEKLGARSRTEAAALAGGSNP